jgi:5-methylcytosine-specific restriction endonuclease McrA
MDVLAHQSVLVLNRLWQAVNVCSARRAFTLLYAGHAQVVEESSGNFQTFNFPQWRNVSQFHPREEEMVKTISFKIRIPKIIVLLIFDRLPQKDVKLTRHNIFERDNFTCQYCGKKFERKDLNLDHVVPRDKGGQTTWDNIVCSCIPCNTRKGNHLAYQVGMKLIRKPKKPKLRPFLSLSSSKSTHHSWKHFVDLAYWHVELSD